MRFVIIHDPNYCAGGRETFRVHKAGCKDITKHTQHYNFSLAGSVSNYEADNGKAAVAQAVAEYAKMEMDWAPSDFHICNCAK